MVASVKAVKVKATVDKDIPQLLTGDKMLLTKTLNNLLSNAIKFTPQDSTVTLEIYKNDYQWFIQRK